MTLRYKNMLRSIPHPEWRQDRGRRKTQEDAWSQHQSGNSLLCAVFDGHNGDAVALWCKANMLNLYIDMAQTRHPLDALGAAFEETDSLLREEAERRGVEGGCTATIAVLNNDQLYVGNVGDSRIILIRCGQAIDVSRSHNVRDITIQEYKRIRDSGGEIYHDRLNGVLNLTRALGDFDFQPALSPCPTISFTTLEDQDTVLIIATDGLWDVLSPQKAADAIAEISDPAEMAQILLQKSKQDGYDNITIGIIPLNSTGSSARHPTYRGWFNRG